MDRLGAHGWLLRRLRMARRPHTLLAVPLIVLLGQMVSGQIGMLAMVVLCPVVLAIALPSEAEWQGWAVDPSTGLIRLDGVERFLDSALATSGRKGWSTGALMIEIDDFRGLEARLGLTQTDYILRTCARRLADTIRDGDLAGRGEGCSFVVALSPVRRLDLETALQLATRVQQALAAPIRIEGINVYVSVSVGFALGQRLNRPTGAAVLRGAAIALAEAIKVGPSAVRSYSTSMQDRVMSRANLVDQVTAALESGQIAPFFQPQVDARTNRLTGFEALARWTHPDRGLIPPIEFLPALEQAGLMGQLGEVMVRDALAALAEWDRLEFDVPQVAVNFSTAELRDPRLVDRIEWELERHNLEPHRLAVEVLETVVASRSEDSIIRNLAALAALGCKLDLDDFGTGHASITSIRQFSIQRIKIDRSFVTRIDEDPEQQNMVAAIITMAERMGLETLAEGVETDQEQVMLADLGCRHVQGFGIARPMTLRDATGWIHARSAPLAGTIPFQRRAV